MTLQERCKQTIKLCLSFFLFYTGIVSLYRNKKMKTRAVILMYHRVESPSDPFIDYSPDGMKVRLKVFEKHIKYLSQNYTVISLSELISLINQKESELPANLCVITFDDGWKDVYVNAYPILKKYSLPATIFLTPNYIDGKNWFWEERLKYVLSELFELNQKGRFNVSSSNLEKLKELGIDVFLSITSRDLQPSLMNLIWQVRPKPEPWRSNMIEEVERMITFSHSSAAKPFLSWQEIMEMAQNGIDFGAHTVSHYNLNSCPEDKARKEIRDSKAIIEEKLDCSIDTFAYPYGKYNESVKKIVMEEELSCACSTESGFVDGGSDLYVLKRINIHEDVSLTQPMYACRILRMLNLF